MLSSSKKLLLIILDGWGIGKTDQYNAIYQARTPFFDEAWERSPRAELRTHGEDVGLLPGQMGSSEVGHMTIGAGRVVPQELTKIARSLKDGSFFMNGVFLEACARAKRGGKKLHLVGMVSDGGIHSHETHLHSLLRLFQRENAERVFVHAFLDGRDTPPRSASLYLERLTSSIRDCGSSAKIATISGRFYLDRDARFPITEKAVTALLFGRGETGKTFDKVIENNYALGITDEFILPTILDLRGLIEPGDSVIFFHFRSDRMRQLVLKLYERLPGVYMVSMISYGVSAPVHPAFERPSPLRYLSEMLSLAGFPHFKVTETQKYPHLTYFMNGAVEPPYALEERMLVPSPLNDRFDEVPEMRAGEITQSAESALGKYPVILMNYANPDMVGHTGNLKAVVEACEYVDQCLSRLVPKARDCGYDVIITADHGNAEEMWDFKSNGPHTFHTLNPAPFILISDSRYTLRSRGGLMNIAPTALAILGIEKPEEMGGTLFQ